MPLTTRDQWLGWLVGGWEVVQTMALAVWLLSSPALFRMYYPALGPASHGDDALAVVQWLSSTERERSLNLALTDGRLGQKELKHYSDVRRVFRWLPPAATSSLIAGLALLILARPSHSILTAAQYRGLMLWSIMLLLVGGFTWWDWPRFFAWVHHPLFGDTSWRLPHDSYSLQLFPAKFWRQLLAIIILTPAVAVGTIALVLRGFKDPCSAPGGPAL